MKKHKTKLLLLGVSCMALLNYANAQSTNGGGANTFIPGRFLGFSNNGIPLFPAILHVKNKNSIGN